MVLVVLRALFVLLMAAIGWFYLSNGHSVGTNTQYVMPLTLSLGVFFLCVDILAPRRKLAVFSGAILGLMVGVAMAFALSFVVKLVADVVPTGSVVLTADRRDFLISTLNVIVGTVCCYFSISFILQTRDDFRFIIPYVEFSRQQKGPRPMLLDSSVLIDGRIGELCETGIFESQLIVPTFIVNELQALADSADKIKRTRGRRGLDILAALRGNISTDIKIYEATHLTDNNIAVDQKLIRLAKELNARVVSNDFNMNAVAQLGGVDVINLNKIASVMRPPVLPGEKLSVRIVRAGEEAGQGVGFLEDGTMVVVEQARHHLNEELEITVSRAHQTSAGRMVFGRISGGEAPVPVQMPPRRPRSQTDATATG
jgi:uncharacterized protein YacL